MAADPVELVATIARGLVENVDAVEVRQGTDEDSHMTLALQVAAEDRGKVIGKRGRMAHAMRTLLSACKLEGSTPVLEIVD